MQINVRVLMTRKGTVQGFNHGGGDVAMEVKGRHNPSAWTRQIADRLDQIAFKIMDTIDHTSAMKIQKDPVNG